ncbi:CoA-binding protein [Helicovermis profundi]|uniref:CoA-binding protein n=1 Tax=Helicovermis profundi TaxID=3065157 RepID=A0AAU9EU71_9FIRM|nr:CoA-binding protein [Clostridia bacterium S502]
MQNTINEMLDKKVWAVVGATKNEAKFAYKIYKKLLSKGYTVYPVNPVYDEIEGNICYGSLEELPEKPDCINVVVSPKRAIKPIEDAYKLGIEYIWFQPGAFDDETIKLANEKNLKSVYHKCVLVELG